jgi:hypothetical protein
MNVWLAPLVALTVGFVTALLTGMQLIVGKENKVSEFRQDWINEQRKDLAAALAAAETYRRSKVYERNESLAVFDAAQSRIELRENSDVEEWTEVRAALVSLRSDMVSDQLDDPKLAAHRLEVYEHARPTLKKNWTVVKEGERWFWIFKRAYAILIITFIVVAAGWMLITAVRSWFAPVAQTNTIKVKASPKATLPAQAARFGPAPLATARPTPAASATP